MIPECNTLAVSAKYHAYRRSWSALFHLWDNINEHRTHRLICPFSFQVDAVTGYRARKKLLYSLHIWIFELDRLKYKNCYFSTQQRKPSKSSHKVALHSICFGRPLWSKEIGKSPLLVSTIVIEGWSLYFHCLKSIYGLSDSVVTRHSIMMVSFIMATEAKKPEELLFIVCL